MELEARFRALASRLQHARIDDQTGAAGEHWSLVGAVDALAGQEFETLSAIAGGMLTEALRNRADARRILDHPHPKIRWYRALKEFSGMHRSGYPAWQVNEAGEKEFIHSGSINRPAETAANVCLQLHVRHPIQPRWYERIYDDYGKQIIIGLVLALAAALIGLWFK